MVPTRVAISSQLAGIKAVWGMGSPSGRRNIAVTANQSARPPTMPASAMARIQPPHQRGAEGEGGDGQPDRHQEDDQGQSALREASGVFIAISIL